MSPQRTKRPRSGLPTEFVSILLLLSNLQHGGSFSVQPRRATVPSLSRYSEEFCQEGSKVQCWVLPRLGLQPYSTKLCDSSETEQEVETSIINTNFNGAVALSNGIASSNGINGFSNGVSVIDSLPVLDIPKPTENGGYTHTAASKAKIAAANKGKTPWNKGKPRSEEVKARIAAGVRAKNRERFLQKLKDMGLTEEEYEAQKKEERRQKEAERRARRTAKGGYRPTEETKAKISRILKEKYARGEIKRKKVDPSKVRKGFKQSAETRAKISDSLKKRWATDTEYRERMKRVVTKANRAPEVREKISASLKKKWKDPEFRSEMLARISDRNSRSNYGEVHRQKISRAMKEKWQDPEYREKTVKSINKRNEELRRKLPRKPRAKKSQVKGAAKGVAKKGGIQLVEPITSGKSTTKKKKSKAATKKTIRRMKRDEDDSVRPRAVKVKERGAAKKAPAKKKKRKEKPKEKEPDGSVNRLKEERRDLFDLLYGDESFDDDDDDGDVDGESGSLRPSSARFSLGDEDLDSFDPYGLDDY